MTPSDLLAALPDAELRPASDGAAGVLTDVTHDSRSAAPGVLFAARPGANADGHDFAAVAVAAGAPALLVERFLPELDVTQIRVRSVAAALGLAAAAVHGHPARAMTMCGITGTNGKTTTTFLVDAALRAAGRTTGLIGTVETRVGGHTVAGARTTPESTDLQRRFVEMVHAGVTHVVMEVSSHGLQLGRLQGTTFDVALFTNLTQDHLDFHPSMEDYYTAKAALFDAAHTDVGIVTVDDPWGERLAREATCEVLTLSRHGPADFVARQVDSHAGGSTFVAHLPDGRVDVTVHLPGGYNVTNALGAVAMAWRVGIDPAAAARGIAALPGVPGRMERVDAGQPFTVLVDYAHTPDSVANVLSAARAVTDGRLICVIGCGGDRDRSKRPAMAAAAVATADLSIFTSDNPRSEPPEQILDDMVRGVDGSAGPAVPAHCWRREVDRTGAIHQALDLARDGDVVVIAGKGHEPYQELAGGRIDYDDRAVARAHLERRA